MLHLLQLKGISTSGIWPHLLQVKHRIYSTCCCVAMLSMFDSQNIGKLQLGEAPVEFMQAQLPVVYGSFHWGGKNHLLTQNNYQEVL